MPPQKLLATVSNVADGIVVTDENGRFIPFNQAAERMMDWHAERREHSTLARR